MKTSELRTIVKNTLIAQGGMFYGFNFNNIAAAYGVSHSAIQNAHNYFRHSPQQAAFRAQYNVQ